MEVTQTTRVSDLSEVKASFTAALKSLIDRGIDVPACVFLLDLLRDDELEASWHVIDNQSQLCWRRKSGTHRNRRFKAPNDEIAAVLMLFLDGEMITTVLPGPEGKLVFAMPPKGRSEGVN